MESLRVRNIDLSSFGKKSVWFLLWGIALIIIGAAAISAATFTTLLSVLFLGTLIFISGVVVTLDTFVFWWGKWSGFFLHLIMGILYLGVGLLMIKTPVFTAASITLLLGIFYLLIGASRIISSTAIQLPRWKWAFFNGIVSFILGLLILTNWPASSLIIIGLFVGIDIFFAGIAFFMMGLAAKSMKRM